MLKGTLRFFCGFLLVVLGSSLSVASAQAPRISESATFSLITDAPGADLYMAFGHSAIRLRDSVQDLDVVFNYGTFDFGESNFYLKFARGKLLYALSDCYFSEYVNKPIPGCTEQELLLTSEQKKALFRFLVINLQEENRKYAYDFFYDNCATRIQDALVSVCGYTLKFPQRTADKSFRDLLHEYLGVHPWMQLGIDIALGLPADRIATSDQQMFLPDYLSLTFAGSTMKGRPLTGPVKYISGSKEVWMPKKPFPLPLACGWALFLLGMAVTFSKNPFLTLWFDRVFFMSLGILGVVIFFLWFLTAHAAAKNNLNLFWAYPWHVVAIFYLHRVKLPCWVSAGLKVTAVSAFILLATWLFLPQDLNEALIPVVLLVLIRSALLAWPERVHRMFCSKSTHSK